jgi:hypothetical protein
MTAEGLAYTVRYEKSKDVITSCFYVHVTVHRETFPYNKKKIRAAAGAGWNCTSVLILLLLESCLQTCMTYTIADCTVNNS